MLIYLKILYTPHFLPRSTKSYIGSFSGKAFATQAWGPKYDHQNLHNRGRNGVWWCTPLTPALRRQKQVDLCEIEASQIYIGSPRTAKVS